MYNHNKAQQSKKPCAYFLGYTVDPRGASSPADGETQQTRPVRRLGTTCLTAVKQQLSEALDENSRLKNAFGLLENDIDAKNKNVIKFRKHDTVQKSGIRQLSQHINELKKELLTYKSSNNTCGNTNPVFPRGWWTTSQSRRD